MKKILVIIILIILGISNNVFAATFVTKDSITWTFNSNYTIGQYNNGDYWVLDSGSGVVINEITPLSTDIAGRIQHGSMINPIEQANGYDSHFGGSCSVPYSAELNVGRPGGNDLSDLNPITLHAGDSLVSTRTNNIENVRPQIVDAAVLTIVSVIPNPGSFRPAYSSTNTTSNWNSTNIHWDRLNNLDKSTLTKVPTLATLNGYMDSLWLDHGYGTYCGREFHPSNNMPDYGGNIANVISSVSLALALDYTEVEKTQMLIQLLQYGIDTYGIISNASCTTNCSSQGGYYMGGGGHGIGRQWPVVFTGHILDDAGMSSWGNASEHPIYQIQQQHFYVTQNDVDLARYSGDGRPREAYLVSDIGIAEWGEQHLNAPQRDGNNWNAYYRDIVSNSTSGIALAARIYGVIDKVAWPSYFEYQDRWHECIDDAGCTAGTGYINLFSEEMWDTYRNNYTNDTTAPILFETTPILTPSTNTTPTYTFSSNEAGIITYGGDCSSIITDAINGENTVTFNALATGAHNNCTITVTDTANNTSDVLNISEFVIEPITQRDFYLDNLATGLNNGTSWENAYQSWADVDLEILDGGGTVYISGGTVSKTYNITAPIALHYTIDGTPDDPIIFKVSQEAGHNGMVVIDGGDVSTNIFDITNNDYIIIDGEVDGERHMRLQNWGVTVPNGVRHPAIKGSGGASGPTGSIIRYLEIINDDTSCATEACEAGVDIDYKSCIVLTSGYDRGITIEHNYLDGCIRLGIGIGSNSASGYPMGTNTVRFNEVKGYRNHKGLGGPDGIKGLGSTDVYNNIVYHEELLNAEMNPSHIAEDGIQMLGDNIRVYNNIVHGYSQGAIRHDELVTPVTNVYIYNNLVYQSHYNPEFTVQRGIQFDCDEYSDVKIYNNTIVGYTYLGLHINHRGGSPQDVSIYNNLLVDSPFRASDPLTGENISNNLTIKSDGTHGIISDSITQTVDPYDANKAFSFVSYTPNTVNNDFRLTANSNMVIDTGTTLGLFNKDINGVSRPVGAGWDIGAYEYVIDSTPPTISEITPIPTPTTNTTPSYTFFSNEAGTISYEGDCSSTTNSAIAGNNIIVFNTLPEGTYSNCTIKITDTALNESNILTIPIFTIGINVSFSKFTPKIKIKGLSKKYKLDKRKKIYLKKGSISFSDKILEVAGGRVKLVINGKVEDEATVGINGRWKVGEKIRKDGTYKIRFKYFDNAGNFLGESNKYKIKIDTRKPKFIRLPKFLTKRKGDVVYFEATDKKSKKVKRKKSIKYYRYYFDGKKGKTKKPEFVIPAEVVKGLHTLIVRAYDKAGNRAEGKIIIKVN